MAIQRCVNPSFKHLWWQFPTLTQLLFSCLLPFFTGWSLAGVGYIFLFASLPACLFGLICTAYRFHQRNLIQLAFWAGTITFLNTLIFFTILLAFDPQTALSHWEQTIALLCYALMFALPSIFYALVILRLFLPQKV